MTIQEKNISEQDGLRSGARAQVIAKQLEMLLGNAYADFDVSREKVQRLADQGRRLADEGLAWLGGPQEKKRFLQALNELESRIHKILDLKVLKEAGLIRVARL